MSEFNQKTVNDLVSYDYFPYSLIKAYLRFRGNSGDTGVTFAETQGRRDLVNVEICRWAADKGVLNHEDFNLACVWHQLHDDFHELTERGVDFFHKKYTAMFTRSSDLI